MVPTRSLNPSTRRKTNVSKPEKLRVVLVEPGQHAREAEIDNTLEAKQAVVGGQPRQEYQPRAIFTGPANPISDDAVWGLAALFQHMHGTSPFPGNSPLTVPPPRRHVNPRRSVWGFFHRERAVFQQSLNKFPPLLGR